ncbi:MAG: hypothetical protein AAF533_25435 [Acidobacteriota bacterium]
MSRSGTTRRRLPTLELGPAFLSLLIAVLAWALVKGQERVPAGFEVPLELVLPPGMVLVGEVPETVGLRVRAPRRKLRTLTDADFRVVLRSLTTRPGTRREVITPQDVDAPFGVAIDSVTPARFLAAYDVVSTRRLPLTPSHVGEPADGHAVQALRIEPPSAVAVVQGPRGLLDELESIALEPVSVAGRSESFQLGGAIARAPAGCELLESPAVLVNIDIGALTGQQSFAAVQVGKRHGRWESSPLNPPRLDVIVEGPLPVLRQLSSSSIELAVDLAGLEPRSDDYLLDVSARVDQELCPGCQVVRLRPQRKVHVRVRPKERPDIDGNGPGASAEATPALTSEG